MSEFLGILAALLSSGLGGTAVAATRYVRGAIDPITLGVVRFGIGFACLLPIAILARERWPNRRDWAGTAALGFLFFCLFPILFNAALVFTTAARGGLALSTLPLVTMVAAALLGVERLSLRKSIGVAMAMSGVALALVTGLTHAPADAWRGDILMVGAACCMAIYSVWSRPFIRRSGPLSFTTMGMGVGALCLALLAAFTGGFNALAVLGPAQWAASLYLGSFGSALTFFLWAFALKRTTPTRVAVSVTINPVLASLVGTWILDEPVPLTGLIGLAAVLGGIGVATTRSSKAT